jgi:hypothetical protein
MLVEKYSPPYERYSERTLPVQCVIVTQEQLGREKEQEHQKRTRVPNKSHFGLIYYQ